MLVSIPFVFFLLPETKGVPLTRMDELFALRPLHNAHARLMASLQSENYEGANVQTFGRNKQTSSGDVTPEKDSRGSLELNTATA